MQNWITIMTFSYPQESYVIQGALEAAGIETFLRDELSVQVDNALSPAIGGVKLQVKQEQLDEAYHLLRENGYFKTADNSAAEEIPVLSTHARDISKCPFCSSENIGPKKTYSLWGLIPLLVFLLPLPLFKKNMYCFNCSRNWKYR